MQISSLQLKLSLVAATCFTCALPLLFPKASDIRDVEVSFSSQALLSSLEGEEAVLLVRLAAQLSPEELQRVEAVMADNSARARRPQPGDDLWRLELGRGQAEAALAALEADPAIQLVEPEIYWSLLDIEPPVTTEFEGEGPNDPLYPFQWNLDQIGIEQAWRRSRGEGVVVAVIDTGVAGRDVDEQGWRGVRDLRETDITDGWDFVSNRPLAHDLHGHGTHVAGTIAQSTDNGYGVAGIAPGATIMPLRVLDENGRGSTGGIADSIRWAADNGANIINMSLGGPIPSRVLDDAIQYAHRKGVTVIAAAGNSSTSLPSYPAAYRNVISVSATQFDRTTTFYSNYGRWITMAAPGGNTRVDQSGDGRPDGIMQETIAIGNPNRHEFALYMGTSMASPHVAGVAALIYAQGITHPERIRDILTGTSTREVPRYERDRYGAGLLDADAATRAAINNAQGPRAPLSLLITFFALALASRQRGLRSQVFGLTAATALLFASGGALLFWAGQLIGLSQPAGMWHTSAVLWPSMAIGDASNWSNALWLSAAPAIFAYALLGSLKSRVIRSLLIGAMLGWGIYLFAEALVPLHDVAWIPGAALLDRIWLGANALLLLVAGGAAARRH